MANQRKYALVLSGGGFKGAFQIGALQYLMENGIRHNDGTIVQNPKFDFIAGVSVGALNGSFMAMEDFEGLKKLWEDVKTKGPSEIYTSDLVEIKGDKIQANFNGILKKILPDSLFNVAFKFIFQKQKLLDAIGENFNKIKSIADSQPLRNTLMRVIKRDKFKIPFKMGFASLVNAEYYSPMPKDFDSDEELAKAILASAALPMVFPYISTVTFRKDGVPITTRNLTDGGVRNISPLYDAISYVKENDQNADWHFIIINCSADEEHVDTSNTDPNVVGYAFRASNDILTNEVLGNDYKIFLLINSLVEQAALKDMTLLGSDDLPLIKFKYKVIRPDDPNVLGSDTGDTLDSRRGTLEFREFKGKEIAKREMEIVNDRNWS
jgi:NTE family protein